MILRFNASAILLQRRRKAFACEIISQSIPHMRSVESAVAHMAGFAEQGVDSLDFLELADGIINTFWSVQHIPKTIFIERGPGSDERGDVTQVKITPQSGNEITGT